MITWISVLFCVVIPCLTFQDILELCDDECFNRACLEGRGALDVPCKGSSEAKTCLSGCRLWSKAVTTSCQDVCNETNSSYGQDIHCVVGCSIGISVYLQTLKDEIGVPTAPYLVADSRTNESVTIQWTGSDYKNISYLVQWKYDSPSGTWEYFDPDNPQSAHQLQISGLHPYTKYKFRVAWLILPQYGVLLSEESVVISTLPYGAPSTAPVITSVTAVDSKRLSVSWDAPAFPNGPIISYVLYLRQSPHNPKEPPIIKDVSETEGGLYYMFTNLTPSTTYTIAVATRNAYGEGPKDIRNITTLPKPEPPTGRKFPDPQLVLASQHTVLQQDLSIYDDPLTIYQTGNDSILVRGVDVHVKKNLLFVTDSLGLVHKVLLNGAIGRGDIVIENNSSAPGLLSVDWLNDRLYLVEENQISRCSFSGDNYEVVVVGFTKRPSDIRVDPYNGYLYWILQSPQMHQGLFRVDLERIYQNVITFRDATEVVRDPLLESFALDHKNFRLLVPKPDANTVLSLALDGSDPIDIRANSQGPKFTHTVSLAAHNGVFYWTTGTEMFGEEYHAEESLYYHNAYQLKDTPCLSVKIFHPFTQPYPVPLNPVLDVQAVFQTDLAKIAWQKPRLLGGLGNGAWQKWMYEVHLQDDGTGPLIFGINITDTFYTVHNLKPNTLYSVKVRAYSVGGKGPWSAKFIGKTISKSQQGYPFVVWSAKEGLLKSDIVGENVVPLIHSENLNHTYITGIAWFKDILIFNTNASRVYTYNTTSHYQPRLLPSVSHAASIAVDWMAPKLYWSTPIHQLVSRANLDGTNPEHLPITTVARELVIDSPEGRLYWATSYSVECARLNGAEKTNYFQTGHFSGKHVMGLTLDYDHGQLYWMVRSHVGSVLYTAKKSCQDCGNLASSVREVGSLPEDDVRGPLWYFSERLFWLHESKEALISDEVGCHVATLKGQGLDSLHSMAVVDPSLQPIPYSGLCVVPNVILESQIAVNGTWDNFTVVWEPTSNVNYGLVFYELMVDNGTHRFSVVTSDAHYSYNRNHTLLPYSKLTLALRATTYWATSPQTVISANTPMSIPSAPTHPRVFISHRHSPLGGNQKIEAEFRWSVPISTNGVISHYEVKWWCTETGTGGSRSTGDNKWLFGNELGLKLPNLLANTTYYFQVRAKTTAGLGPFSAVVEGQTSEEHPVPKLLLAKTDAVKVADIDAHEERLLSNKASQPVAVTFLSDTNNVYWIEQGGALMSSRMDGSNTTLVLSLPGSGTGMAVDWVGRYLYWAEADLTRHQHTVWAMDLNQRTHTRLLLNGTHNIGSLDVDPFSSLLLWTFMEDDGDNQLMVCDIDGCDPRPFFLQSSAYHIKKRDTRAPRGCNCPSNPAVGQVVTIDRSWPSKPEVLWVDARIGHIWASDMLGCHCRILVNATEVKDNGLPPDSLTANKEHVYWSNSSLGRVFSIEKEVPIHSTSVRSDGRMPISAAHYKSQVSSEAMLGVRGIRAVGEHLQPYPDSSCLWPLPYNHQATLVRRSPNMLILQVPKAERPSICEKVSLSSVVYTVYYGEIRGNGSNNCDYTLKYCKILETYNVTFTLKNLQPFTNYSVQVSASNYYSQGKVPPGPPEVFSTREGAPSAPVDVAALVRTPNRIDVLWQPSAVPNGNPIWYEVRWHSAMEASTGQSSLNTLQPESFGGNHYMSLPQLAPNTTHYIIVRAYSSVGDLYSDSVEINATTFEQPHNVTLVDTTSRSLLLEWLSSVGIAHHSLQYKEVGTDRWEDVTSASTVASLMYNFSLAGLTPKNSYAVRLELYFEDSDVAYTWPREHGFLFQTFGDLPDVPGPPEVQALGRDVYRAVWGEVSRNGGEDMLYELQLRSVPEQVNFILQSGNETTSDNMTSSAEEYPPLNAEWSTVYNGSHPHWMIVELQSHVQYEFRVRAITEYGASNYSTVGASFILPEPEAITEPAGEQTEVILIAVFCASVFIVVALLAALYIVQRQRDKEKKVLQPNGQILHAPDVELANLRELPQHSNFVQQTNALYAVGDIPTDEELSTISHISREQIGLTKFLGSGAFGEVFEGTAYNLRPDGNADVATKVAIKTLRKGATEQEKGEFLKEAKLMSNFQHEHILKLLGICLNNNPNFIILELMEGGDLRSYLISNRPTAIHPGSLTLDDLFDICVDVAKGCKYLEDMHFVHRDLAARNCLVSSHNPATRIVKIGDFGLARDIYKNDYYRKEGEGLLPVRWMAPESLIDGIFTCQSDVWSFGVLLWEVVTFGQQPYPAMNNVEVLRFVRGGGRLDKPGCCPEDMHELMLKCWSYIPESRPTFSYCLETLQDVKHKNSAQSTPVLSHNYIGRYYDEELAKLRDNASSDQRPLLLDRPSDSLSTCSDPSINTLQEMLSQLNGVKRAGSFNCPTTQRIHKLSPNSCTSASCSSSPLLKATLRRNGLVAAESAKYLELLADTDCPTDADGYEIPLPPPLDRRRNYADLHRSPSCCSASSSSSANQSNDLQENIDPNRSLRSAGVDNYIVRTKSKVSKTGSSEGSKSPMVTSALLKSPASPSFSETSSTSEERLGVSMEAMNPFFNEPLHNGLTCTPSCHRCGDQSMIVPYCSHADSWSMSSASTATCHDSDNKRSSGISTLSALSGVELNYTPKSSWC